MNPLDCEVDNDARTCTLCGWIAPARHVRRNCPKKRGSADSGYGTELHKLLDSLGIQPSKSCNCAEMIRRMNAWGGGGCLDHLEEIVAHLRTAYKETSWTDRRRAELAALTTGLAWEIDWRDPLPSLVRLAVERARPPR